MSQDESQAIGIFRGEGTTWCSVTPKIKGSGASVTLRSTVRMCDRDSVELVARAWGSPLRERASEQCPKRVVYETNVSGRRVEETVRRWIIEGSLRGEKADQYWNAKAKCLRARRTLFPFKGRVADKF